MSANAPSLPLFGDAYMADTTHLTLEEHGAYLKLMMVAWRVDGCALPDDDARLARILGITTGRWAKLKPTVMGFWTLADGQWKQKRLSKEREFVARKSANNSAAANARWSAQPIENTQDDEGERISERNAPPPSPPKKEESKGDASASLRAREPVGEAFDLWNEVATQARWPLVTKRTASRQAVLRTRLRDDGIDGWRSALARARASPFLCGDDPPGFMAFDWFVKSQNFTKVVEGNYDNDIRQRPAVHHGRSEPVSPSLAFLRYAEALPDDGNDDAGNGTSDRQAWPAMRALR